MSTTRKTYRYDWPKKAIKGECPQCGHAKTLSRYIDTQTGETLPDSYGRCDRESNCGYFLSPYAKGPSGTSYADEQGRGDAIPKAWFVAAGKWKRTGSTQEGIAQTLQVMEGATQQQAETVAAYVFTPKGPLQPTPIYSIPEEIFQASLGHYQKNQLAILLTNRFGSDAASQLLNRFQIGTSARWKGACVFWYIDELGRKRGGQIKLFGDDWHTIKYVDSEGRKRNKTSWVHSALTYRLEQAGKPIPEWLVDYNQKAERSPCLFGLPQLVSAPVGQPVAIVEAPKTALICTLYFPEFTWLAVGALSYLNAERLRPLRSRKIMLFPDLNAYQAWEQRAEMLRTKGFRIDLSDLLEEIATDEERQQGLDLADYLLASDRYVSNLDDWRSGLILRPDESQLERLSVEVSQCYPHYWDLPNVMDAQPLTDL